MWKDHKTVLCSDGDKPFGFDVNPGESVVPRLLRCQEVVDNQALALRKRWLISSFETKVYEGSYWGIGTEIANYAQHGKGFTGEVLDVLRNVRTDLNSFASGEQAVIMNHGWALTGAALQSYCDEILGTSLPPGVPPDEQLLDDQQAALTALAGGA